MSEVSKWESGKRRPPEDVIEAFESVFSTPPGYLLEAAGYTKAAKYRRLTARNQQLQALSDVATPSVIVYCVLAQRTGLSGDYTTRVNLH